jgi:hypothetical protein
MYQPFTRHTRQFHDASRARSAPGKLARIGSVLGMLSLTAATSVVLQQEAKPLVASAVTPLSAVTDVNPNSLSSGTLFGGRTVNFAVNPINTQIVFAATEYGGLWRSVDHGSSWSHVDQVPLTAMQDVKFGSSDANLVIASGAYDGSIDNRGGGIWRSTDGGNNWAKAPGSDVCATLAQNNGKEIAIASGNPGSLSVFVGMDCGIAKSTDSGASWSLVNPPGTSKHVRLAGTSRWTPAGTADMSVPSMAATRGRPGPTTRRRHFLTPSSATRLQPPTPTIRAVWRPPLRTPTPFS